ncbi:hypothetical protein AVEN_15995-1 [Araneus ventricosus]|uniref:Uncharacterized protein n=1 Tax=Araneus ventricosus TaxID=182803 RepID=A0A4Y2UBG1_ARAVE|nr:hypothetical protein AVEN_15995-1 [Araneus ventricosus]
MNSDRSSTIQFYLCHTALSRFVSGHLRSCSFSHGNKVFPVCAKCGVASASPEHILSCLRLSRETFETDPLLALDFLREDHIPLNLSDSQWDSPEVMTRCKQDLPETLYKQNFAFKSNIAFHKEFRHIN